MELKLKSESKARLVADFQELRQEAENYLAQPHSQVSLPPDFPKLNKLAPFALQVALIDSSFTITEQQRGPETDFRTSLTTATNISCPQEPSLRLNSEAQTAKFEEEHLSFKGPSPFLDSDPPQQQQHILTLEQEEQMIP